MTTRKPATVRAHAFLLRRLVPHLGEEYVRDASAAFQELDREAREGGVVRRLAFLTREARSLLTTAAEHRRNPSKGQGRGTGGDFDAIRQDVSYAFRSLRRAPGFVAVTLLSLSFAIAVSTVIFSVVNAGFIRDVPNVAAQDRLVRIFTRSRQYSRGTNSFPDFEDYRDMSRTLSDVAAAQSERFSVGEPSRRTRRVQGLEVSENYFDVLGIALVRGRSFLAEDVAGGGRVVVIGYNTWQRYFDGDEGVLGRAMYLNGHPHTIIGVGPRGMVGLGDPLLVEIVRPLMSFRDRRGRRWLDVVGRLQDGATVTQAQAEFEAIGRQLGEAHPGAWHAGADDPTRIHLLSLREARIPEGAPMATVFGGVAFLAGLIMLIACSNVANLLLTRASRRRAEIAVRCALGAPRHRIFGQLLTENLLLFTVAGGLGLLVTHGLTSILQGGLAALPIPGMEVSVDARVALFTLVLTLATGLTFGLVPALQASRPDVVPALKGATRTTRFRFLGMRNLLVGAQVGGSLVLVLVTLLLVRSLSYAETLDLGHDPTGIATLSVDVSHREYGEEEGMRFYTDLLERAAHLPDVDAVGLARWVPLSGGSTVYAGLEPEGYQVGPQEYVSATAAVVTPGYFSMTRMKLLAGRDFTPEDRAGAPAVVVVNQSLVDRYWPDGQGVGKHIGTTGVGEGFQVIGVVADVPYRDLSPDVMPHMWMPLAQNFAADLVLHARTPGDPRALLPLMRRQVAELDPNLPVIDMDLMADISTNATQPQRILSGALAGTGLFALALAMLGIYGVVGYSVSQRTREMGLRMALGAEPRRLIGLVLGEGVVISLIGLVPGLLGAFAASQLIRALLLGMEPLDPLAFGGGVAILLLSVVAASLAPGIRASRADPMASLRAE